MKKQIFTLAALALAFGAWSQSNLRQTIRGEQGISKHFVDFTAGQQVAFSTLQAKNIFGIDPNSDLVLINTEKDQLGQIHYRFYQNYKGIPVENSMYIAHTGSGKLTGASGSIVVDFDASMAFKTSVTLTAQQAIDAALKNVNAQQYMWQDAGMEQRIKEETGNTKSTYYPAAKLVWYNAGDDISPKDLRLAFKVDIYAERPLSRADYFIDAKTGALLGKNDRMYYSDATGTANTEYSGTQTIHSDLSGGTYKLHDLTRGNGVFTYKGNSNTDYTSTSANWNLTGQDQHAMDVHWGIEETYDFYETTFNRNSLDNSGLALKGHANDGEINNAHWDGSAMYFGVRSGSNNGVTGIDVTGHELTHGVTQYTCNLNYSGESGGMNESMSDIMGKSVQFFAKPSDINWQLSNDMGWIIRDMSNPKLEHQPDCVGGQYWKANADVHILSGVGNFLYYLLVNGKKGTNDLGNAYKVKGIGLAEAEQIIYRTETVYLTKTSKYADWRIACINAATDLYGATSKEVKTVKNAWYAVGVGTAAFDDVYTIADAKATLSISPNPVSGSAASISYSIAKTGNILVKVVDLNGRAYTQDVNLGIQDAGAHSYTLNNLAKLPTGSYEMIVQENGALVARTRFLISH